MTSEVAAIGLTYDGVDIQNITGNFLEVVRGLNEVAEVRGVDPVMPGAPGRWVGNRRPDRRTIELRGFVRGAGATEDDQRSSFRDRARTLQLLFDPTQMADLVALAENGDTYTIQARTLTILYDQIVPAHAQVSIEMESVAPNWTVTAGGS